MTQLTLQQGVEVLRSYLSLLPAKPGVYRMIDGDGKVLYVGKAKALSKRVVQYTQIERLNYRLQHMVASIRSLEYTITTTEAEALLLEANLIKKLEPRYNILLRDDKTYPYLLITRNHPYPRLCKYRGKERPKGSYYGPFATAGAMKHIIKDLQKAFLIRPCTDSFFANRTRPCMEYQIKRCSAPCVNYIAKEEYAELVAQTEAFLSGKSREVQEDLAKKMEEASREMEYERAAILRDRIRALNAIQSRQHVELQSVDDADVMVYFQQAGQCCVQVVFFRGGRLLGGHAYFPEQAEEQAPEAVLQAFMLQFYQQYLPPKEIFLSHLPDDVGMLEEALTSFAENYKVRLAAPKRGDKHQLVQQALTNAEAALSQAITRATAQQEVLTKVQEMFALPREPQRIEIYDNSHIMGTHQVGAMVVATPDGFQKRSYRRFNIDREDIAGGDDYGMMREVMRRRLQRLLSDARDYQAGIWPDLLMIDGGKGQLSAVMGILEEFKLADKIACVAIAKGEDRNAGREDFYLPGKAPFKLPPTDPVLYYLQRLRDEAHRFAIGSHRAKRSRALSQSTLDEIPGVGGKRKKALLRHFGSVSEVKKATPEMLLKVEGINRALADEIYRFFQGG